MFTFMWPYLIALLPIPFLVRRFWPATEDAGSPEVPRLHFPHLTELQQAYRHSPAEKRTSGHLLSLLLGICWTFLVLALMRPQIVDHVSEVKSEGHDLMLAVDLSGSMRSLDFSNGHVRVSRLDVAKGVVSDFVKKRSGDRIGLVLFGQRAFLQTPLTQDTNAVSEMLDHSVSGMAGDSTAIGDAIGLSVKNLRERPAGSKAIILLTDGEDNASTIPPVQAAELAKDYGIHIYTVVIGTDGLVPIPDENGNIVMAESHTDTTLTRQIAEMTGGAFYQATDQEGLARIYDRIDELEKSPSESRSILIRKPLYPYPLGAALALLAVIGVLGMSKRGSYEFRSV